MHIYIYTRERKRKREIERERERDRERERERESERERERARESERERERARARAREVGSQQDLHHSAWLRKDLRHLLNASLLPKIDLSAAAALVRAPNCQELMLAGRVGAGTQPAAAAERAPCPAPCSALPSCVCSLCVYNGSKEN